jgi:CubicO group peptidase (beta-lactamase class C family)
MAAKKSPLKKALTHGSLTLFIFALIFYWGNISRLATAVTLFEKPFIVENFRSMKDVFQASTITKSKQAYQFSRTERALQLPETFELKGETINTREFLEFTQTNGLIVIQHDEILLEEYHLGHTAETQHISWSMAKSVVSALIGIALEEGHINNIDQLVTDYAPELMGTGYEGVTIKDALQMSSGVEFNEDYADFFSDINRFGRTIALGGSFDDFAASLKSARKPGTFNHYVSIDTHVLGMVLSRATKSNLSDYMQEKLWNKIGSEHDAYWITDDNHVEMALGGLNITLRDYARLGRLYLNKGNWNGEQVVPAHWVQRSVTPEGAHVQPGINPNSSSTFGYGFQWWLPEVPQGDFFAAGIYNQFIYVHPERDLVLVKLSSNYHFKEAGDNSKKQSIALFQTIAALLDEPATAKAENSTL